MKRAKNLIDKIADMDNLLLAFYKAKRGKEDRQEVILFSNNISEEINKLNYQIYTGNIETGNYQLFKIFDPKERIICAAPFSQRVLHHAIMNICHIYFDRKQIYHSYASRIGKGTYAALKQAYNNTKKYQWFLKLDVKKYFDSIDHFVLLDQLNKIFKDDQLLKIFNKIVLSYHVTNNRGLPIGNLTSQYFANHYLAVADHYVKEILHIPAYVRYMDDMVLWHHDKKELFSIGKKYEDFIKHSLNISLKPFCMNYSMKGLPFLGYLLFPYKIRISGNSRNRFIKKYLFYTQQLSENKISQSSYQDHMLPLLAFIEYADTINFRRKVFRYT